MPVPEPFQLRTLGELRLTGMAGELLAGRRKELVLLAYLGRKSPHPGARDDLAALHVSALERDLAAGRVADAAERWRGDFLPGLQSAGWYRGWLDGEREALRRLAGSAFTRVLQGPRESGDLDAELRWAR